MMFKSLLALGLVVAFAVGTQAQAAEPKADILFFRDADQETGLIAYWTAQGFRVHVLDVFDSDTKNHGVMLDSSVRKLIVAGSYRGANLAIQFSKSHSSLISGLILIEPDVSGQEELTPRVPVLVERLDKLNPLKLWAHRQVRQGKNVQDVGFFSPEELHEKLGLRLTVDFMNAVLAGSLKRVVP